MEGAKRADDSQRRIDDIAAPLMWPSRDRYVLDTLGLDLSSLRGATPGWRNLVRVATISDVLRAGQRRNATFVCESAARELYREMSRELAEYATTVVDPDLAAVVELRAREAATRDFGLAAKRNVDVGLGHVILLNGPMITWRGKASAYLQSTIAAIRRDDLTSTVDSLHARVDELRAHYETILDTPLALADVPAFVVSDLVLAGGEAAAYPKHFGFFLPSDEQVTDAREFVTLVHANVYESRYRRISLPLLAAACASSQERVHASDGDIVRLVSWFKAHDVGHMWRLDATDLDALQRFGHYAAMMLQEALADTLGYLAVAGPWSAPGEPEDAPVATFLAEALRYVRRGVRPFSDSGAAFAELKFLSTHGYLAIDDDGRVDWRRTSFDEGMRRLALVLSRAVLQGDARAGEEFLEAYAPASDVEFSPLLARTLALAGMVPDDLAYGPRADVSVAS